MPAPQVLQYVFSNTYDRICFSNYVSFQFSADAIAKRLLLRLLLGHGSIFPKRPNFIHEGYAPGTGSLKCRQPTKHRRVSMDNVNRRSIDKLQNATAQKPYHCRFAERRPAARNRTARENS